MEQGAAVAVSGTAALADDRLYPARPILAASVAVMRQGRVLLARRAKPPGAGRFSLPGGLVEPGETLGDAALRELAEETGVTARILGFNRHVEVIERDEAGDVRRHFVVASFVGAWVAGDGVVGPEASEIVWATREEATGLPVTDQLAPVLDGAWRMVVS